MAESLIRLGLAGDCDLEQGTRDLHNLDNPPSISLELLIEMHRDRTPWAIEGQIDSSDKSYGVPARFLGVDGNPSLVGWFYSPHGNDHAPPRPLSKKLDLCPLLDKKILVYRSVVLLLVAK